MPASTFRAWRVPGVGDGGFGGEGGVIRDELAIYLDAAAAAELVHHGQHRGGNRRPGQVLGPHPGDGLVDQRVDVDAAAGGRASSRPPDPSNCQCAVQIRATSGESLTTAETGGPPSAV